jgi:hypothetical protein
MTIFKIYTIYDSKVSAYTIKPFCGQSKGSVVRELFDVVNGPDKSAPLAKHPHDYSLFEIGTFDDSTGVLAPYVAREHVIALHELINNE